MKHEFSPSIFNIGFCPGNIMSKVAKVPNLQLTKTKKSNLS